MHPYDVAYSSDFKNNPKLVFPALRKKEHSIQTDFVDGAILLYIQENQKKGNFYISQQNELGYQKPKKLKGAINSKHLDLSASFSKKDSVMYFSSNRPGGFGGMDLYESKLLSDGSWTTPKNLGDKINTSYNEDAPFFDDDNNILYFSSNGEASIGGYDFFKAELNKDTLGYAYNLGKPFNSSFDDIFITKNKNDFYLSSNRIASQGMDVFNINLTHIDNMLYRWHVTRFPSSIPTTIEQTNCFEFSVEASHQNEGAKVYEWIFNDTDVRKGRTVNYCFEDKTKSNVKLKSITGKYDFVNIEKEYSVDLKDLQLNIIQEGNIYRLKSTNKNINILEAYWRFGTEAYSNLEIESTKELDFAIFSIELNGETHIIKATK